MTDYHFIGAFPRVLVGLSQGVNAWLVGSDAPHGSTIEAFPGCGELVTSEPYAHPELEECTGASDAHGLSPENEAWAQANPVPAEPVAAPVDVPAPVVEPAADAMTAEGAPAPAEPTN